MSGLDENYSRGDRYVEWYLYPAATAKGTSTIDAYSTTSESFSFGGLKEGTSYQIYGIVYWTDGEGKHYKTTDLFDVTTSKPTPPPPSSGISKFSWFKSNGSATADETQKAYNAVTNKGYISDFSYKVWNDMVDKLVEINDYQGWEWLNYVCSLEETKMTSTDKKMTAKRYNSFLYNIKFSGGTTTNYSDLKRTPGDDILGSYFTDIVNYLNHIIDNL